ncbi:hypothetical protein [Sphingobium sp. DC-2]|uniref:hypothetical protein n=1 Tax=Sphingobium sp. DC-2 TaxID=1303256 RepID=UPI0004C345BA|nr:hypothetical protein [Sphingobium sp. DC-2]
MSTQYFSAQVGGLRGPGLTEEQQDSVDQAVADAADAVGKVSPIADVVKTDNPNGFSVTDPTGRALLLVDMLQRLILAGQAKLITDPLGGVSATDPQGRAMFAYDPLQRALTVSGEIRTTKKLKTLMLAEISFFPAYGQSWSMGFENLLTQPKMQRFDNLMFVAGVRTQSFNTSDPDNAARYASLAPLTERQDVGSPKYTTFLPNGLGQTMATAQTDMVKELLAYHNNLTPRDITHRLLSSTPGDGNMSIADLSKGGAYNTYNRLIAQVGAGYDRAADLGMTYDFPMMSWTQGAFSEELEDDYGAVLEQLRLDVQTDTAAVFTRRNPLKLVTWQRYSEPGITPATLYEAYVQAAKDHEHIICAAPSYFLPRVADGATHISSDGTDWLAAYYGLSYYRVVIMGLPKPQPLDTVAFYRQGKHLLVEFNNDYALEFDTDIVAAVANMGFQRFTSLGIEVPISAVQIVGPNIVKISCATNWAASDRLVYGGNGAVGDDVGPVTGNRGNLRDSQGDWIIYDRGFRNLPMHNWCVCFDKVVG